MASCGVIAALALTLLTQAYRIAEANVVAPFEYTALIWSVLYGWMFWREWPDPVSWLGIAIIIGAGTYVFYREQVKAEPIKPAPSAPVLPEPGFETFLWPVNGTVNSAFGPRGSSFHDGIDIAAPEGTPILAIEAGEVIYSDQLRGYGNMVILRHAGGIVSVYAHNESNLVREGQSVVRGEVVARVGSTGRVSGPHLHFEIRRNNAAQDPLRYLPQLCCVTAADSVSPKN